MLKCRLHERRRIDARSISVRSFAFEFNRFVPISAAASTKEIVWLHRGSPISLKSAGTVRTRKYETSRYTHPFSVHFEASGSNLNWCILMRPENRSCWLSVFRRTKTRRFFYLFSVSSFHWLCAVLWHGPLWARLTVHKNVHSKHNCLLNGLVSHINSKSWASQRYTASYSRNYNWKCFSFRRFGMLTACVWVSNNEHSTRVRSGKGDDDSSLKE